jgi:hypothetical protein
MSCLGNSTHRVWTPHVGCWPHATDAKPAYKIKTTKLTRFMTNIQKTNLYDENRE